jgi:hypothetical protein
MSKNQNDNQVKSTAEKLKGIDKELVKNLIRMIDPSEKSLNQDSSPTHYVEKLGIGSEGALSKVNSAKDANLMKDLKRSNPSEKLFNQDSIPPNSIEQRDTSPQKSSAPQNIRKSSAKQNPSKTLHSWTI